jgi:hypothetical protein
LDSIGSVMVMSGSETLSSVVVEDVVPVKALIGEEVQVVIVLLSAVLLWILLQPVSLLEDEMEDEEQLDNDDDDNVTDVDDVVATSEALCEVV